MYPQSIKGKVRVITLLSALQFFCLLAGAQVRYTGSSIDLVVSGTSTLHDWNMKSVKADCNAIFVLNPSGQITGVNSVSFSTPVSGLKSDHTSMDNNAYKALKSDKDPTISFTATSIKVSPAAGGASTVTVTGKLTIAGSTRDVQIATVCVPNADNTIAVSGKEPISMKDFSIDPPTFMFGTIKTGNDITLSFNLKLKRA